MMTQEYENKEERKIEALNITRKQKNALIIVLMGVLAIVWLIPFANTGVVNNDTLMNHLYSVYQPLLYERYSEQGRLIGYYLTYPINLLLNFSENFFINRIKDFCFIMLSLTMLGMLYYKFFHKFTFSCLTVCIGLALMPITFEHTLPQAYCGFALYLAVMVGTVLLFIKWIETGKRSFLLASLLINLYLLFVYEVYIALMPIYVVAAWHALPKDEMNLKKLFHAVKYHIGIGILYLASYVGLHIISPTSYDGNSVGTLSLASIGKVLKHLIASSLPGYYWFNEKYRYIFKYYSNYDAFFEKGGIRAVIAGNVDLSMIFFGIILFVILTLLLYNVHSQKLGNTSAKFVGTVGTGLCFVVLPQLPMAISARYQASVNAADFISVPAVYFSYLAVSFLVSYVIWEMVARFGKKGAFILLAVVMTFSMGIQLMNHVIEGRQQETAHRVKMIETALKTNVVSQLEGMEVYAADLYETIDALGFESAVVDEGYWTLFARHCGHNITLNSSGNESTTLMFYKDEKMGGLVGIRKDNAYYVLADLKQSEPKAVKINNDHYVVAPFGEYILDHGMYVYSYLIIEDTLVPVRGIDASVGNTWSDALKMTNIYEDGFIGLNGDFVIRTGNTGELTIALYCPFEITGDEEYRIFVNGEEMVLAKAEQGNIEHIISTRIQNELAMVHIETNFVQKPDNGDVRELSMIISNVSTE